VAKEFGCQIIYYNAYDGKLLSVNDNPLHATIRRQFLKLPHKTHEESIRSIVKVYRSPSDESVRAAFERVGTTSITPSAKVVRTLYSEEFKPPKNEEKKFSQCLTNIDSTNFQWLATVVSVQENSDQEIKNFKL
jgi:hypothetical protein